MTVTQVYTTDGRVAEVTGAGYVRIDVPPYRRFFFPRPILYSVILLL